MSSKLLSIFAIASTLLCFSCSDESKDDAHSLAKTEYYEDFLWCTYSPKTIDMGKVLVEFADDADSLKTSFKLGVFEIDGNGDKIPLKTSVAQIFFNGVEAEGNRIEVTQDMNEITISAVFNPEAANRSYNWTIEVLDEGRNFDKLANEDGDRIEAFNERFKLEKEKIWNPLAKWMMIIIVTIVILNIIWLIFLRPFFFKKFTINRIRIVGPQPYMQQLNVNKKYLKIVLTNRVQKQGFFEKLYKGEIKYLVNPIWQQDIEIVPINKNSVRIKTQPGGIYIVNMPFLTRQGQNIGILTNTATTENTEITIL